DARRHRAERKVHFESGERMAVTLDADVAAMVAHNRVNVAQAKTGTLSDSFSTEKWIEYAIAVFAEDSGTIVRDLNFDPLATNPAAMHDNQPALALRLTNCIAGVVQEIQEDFLKQRVSPHRRKAFRKIHVQIDSVC